MVVMLEIAPQSNHYHRVLMSREETQKFNAFLAQLFPMPADHKTDDGSPCSCANLIISGTGADLPDMQAFHECTRDQVARGECKH